MNHLKQTVVPALMGFLAFPVSGSVDPHYSPEKPNIVFILVDDMGWKDLGCYENPHIDTPHIDLLARAGILFTQAYAACPVCSPTRASIMTGKYPARLHLTNFLTGNRTDPESPVIPPVWKHELDRDEVFISQLLNQRGYATAMVGKWHLGKIPPWERGFTYTRLIGKNGLDFYNYSIFLDSFNDEFIDHGTDYLTDKLTEYGIEFLQKYHESPFFLYLSYSAPHVYIVPRGDKLSKYLRKYHNSEEKFNPYYAAMVESIDDGVGEIIKTLRELGKLENTLIVFTSDNGGLGMEELGPTPTSLLPLRKWKGHVYEGGIRVPTIISWQNKINAGVTSDYYFTSTDYFPTFCELAGIENIPLPMDGKSLREVLLNPEKVLVDDRGPIFWHYPHFSNQMGRPAGAVRWGDYKLIENYETNKTELYNLIQDISESNDLSEKMKAKSIEMQLLLKEWRRSVNAQMPLPNPDYKKK